MTGITGCGSATMDESESTQTGTGTHLGSHPEPKTEPPMVTSVSPVVGPLHGGSFLTVYGQNFVAGTKLTIDGIPCRAVKVLSPLKATCVTPGHEGGRVALTATNPDQQSSAFPDAFEYVGMPNPLAGFAATSTGAITKSKGIRLTGSIEGSGNPVPISGTGMKARTGLRGALSQ
jgi:hypothetical protein